jgi:hypothetical protein
LRDLVRAWLSACVFAGPAATSLAAITCKPLLAISPGDPHLDHAWALDLASNDRSRRKLLRDALGRL